MYQTSMIPSGGFMSMMVKPQEDSPESPARGKKSSKRPKGLNTKQKVTPLKPNASSYSASTALGSFVESSVVSLVHTNKAVLPNGKDDSNAYQSWLQAFTSFPDDPKRTPLRKEYSVIPIEDSDKVKRKVKEINRQRVCWLQGNDTWGNHEATRSKYSAARFYSVQTRVCAGKSIDSTRPLQNDEWDGTIWINEMSPCGIVKGFEHMSRPPTVADILWESYRKVRPLFQMHYAESRCPIRHYEKQSPAEDLLLLQEVEAEARVVEQIVTQKIVDKINDNLQTYGTPLCKLEMDLETGKEVMRVGEAVYTTDYYLKQLQRREWRAANEELLATPSDEPSERIVIPSNVVEAIRRAKQWYHQTDEPWAGLVKQYILPPPNGEFKGLMSDIRSLSDKRVDDEAHTLLKIGVRVKDYEFNDSKVEQRLALLEAIQRNQQYAFAISERIRLDTWLKERMVHNWDEYPEVIAQRAKLNRRNMRFLDSSTSRNKCVAVTGKAALLKLFRHKDEEGNVIDGAIGRFQKWKSGGMRKISGIETSRDPFAGGIVYRSFTPPRNPNDEVRYASWWAAVLITSGQGELFKELLKMPYPNVDSEVVESTVEVTSVDSSEDIIKARENRLSREMEYFDPVNFTEETAEEILEGEVILKDDPLMGDFEINFVGPEIPQTPEVPFELATAGFKQNVNGIYIPDGQLVFDMRGLTHQELMRSYDWKRNRNGLIVPKGYIVRGVSSKLKDLAGQVFKI